MGKLAHLWPLAAPMKFRPPFFLFGLVVAVYALSYSGAFTVDDEHLFVSGALTFAQTDQLTAPQVYGNTRIHGSYHDVEPGQAVLAALFVHWADAARLGRVQTLFFFNILVTALTVGLVYVTVRVRNYSVRVALATALLYAFTTAAWPYAQTYYRDPLAAFFFMLAYLGFELSIVRPRVAAGSIGGLILGLGLIGGLLAKTTTAVGLIVFPLAALAQIPRHPVTWPNLKWPVVAAVIMEVIPSPKCVIEGKTESRNEKCRPFKIKKLRPFG